MVRAFKKRKAARPASKLESTTLKGFGGGWNAIDEDLSMPPRYQVSLINFHRTSSGSQAVRWGQNFVADVKSTHNSPIVDGYYFNGRSVVVLEDGWILTVDNTGLVTAIWNSTISAALPGAPGAWTPTITQVSFVPFRDTLIIHNGHDKPVSISSAFAVTYLQDLGSGSNTNVPIGKYGCVAANYHCVANTVAKATEVVISSKGTSGTFIGDPAPNDSTSFDVGAYAPEGAASIRGIAGFRTYLLVFLQSVTIQVKLGVYDSTGTKHTPQFPDTLPQFGLLGNRCIVTVENDLMFCGLSGLASARRNLYSPDTVMSDFLSSVVSPAYRSTVGALTDTQQLTDAFAVYDKLNNDFFLFTTGGIVLVYTFNTRLKMHAWSSFQDMDWDAGWASILGRVFLAKGTKIFLSGNSTFAGERFYADRLLDRDYSYAATGPAFAANDLVLDTTDGTIWKCLTTHPRNATYTTFALEREINPSMWSQYLGNPITIEMELPWIDGKDPTKLKQLRYVTVATKGDAEFTFQAYVDNLFKDVEGNVVYDPALSMVFIGNDAYGYGYDDDPYGMGRRSRDPRLYGFPVKFKSIKFRVEGSVSKKLELVNLSFLYARGRYQRA